MTRGDRWWRTSAEVTPGPSPRYVCVRPSCGLVYRTLVFTHTPAPACPRCGQIYLSAHGRRVTRLRRQAEAEGLQ